MSRNIVLSTFSFIGLSLVISACAIDGTPKDASEEGAAAAEGKESAGKESAAKENVGEAQSALFSGYWTGFTSDEYPPVNCPSGYILDAMQTTGSNSDNISLHCGNIGRSAYGQAWSVYFSEEGTNWNICGTNRFIVGFSCNGNYCDNIAIECASFTNVTRGANCYWTPWFSEEQQFQYLDPGYAAAGIQCSGSNCDNMSIYACPVTLN